MLLHEPWKYYTKWKKVSHILYDSIYITRPEQANPQKQKADQYLPRTVGRGEWGETA